MEKMLVVVFDDESKAYEGSHALKQLDAEGSITIHAESVIKKNADGTVTVKQVDDGFPIRTVGGTAIGSLIGLLGGPVGLGVGAVAGALAGSIGDLNVAGVDAEFLDDVCCHAYTRQVCGDRRRQRGVGYSGGYQNGSVGRNRVSHSQKECLRTNKEPEMWRRFGRKSIN